MCVRCFDHGWCHMLWKRKRGPVTFFTFIDCRDPTALGWWWTFMCRPTTPSVTFNVSKWPSLSLTLKTDSHTHAHTVISQKLAHHLKHIIESCCWCDGAAKSNLYAGGLAWSDETSCYFTEGGRKSHSHNCLGEWALRDYPSACVCMCVCAHTSGLVCLCTYCLGSLQYCCAFRSSTTAAGWHLWSLTGRSSLHRCTTPSEPDTSPRRGARTRSESVCLQKYTII